jgi:magnesium transporter
VATAARTPNPAIPAEGRTKSLTYGDVTWVDISDPTSSDTAKLGRDYQFHPLDLEDCVSGRQLTKVEDHGEHFFIMLHFPVKDDQGVISSFQVSMFMGKNYLVSLHPASCKAVSELFRSAKEDERQRGALMKSSTYLGYRIIDELVDGMFSILDGVQENLDSIEATVFDEKKSSAGAINRARRQIAVLGRIVSPLVLFLPDIAGAQKDSEEDLSIYFSDIDHKVGKASATVDEMKEMVEIYKDTDFVINSERTNTVLSILTILFTLTIPATVISSIFGMNVPLPGGWNFGVTGPLDYFGPYTSLLFIFIAMLIPAIVMALYFRRVGWF